MVAYTDAQLEAMGLKPAGGDRNTLKYSDWENRQKDNYIVPDYNEYVPTQVEGAIEK